MRRQSLGPSSPALPPGLQRTLNLLLVGSIGLNAWLIFGSRPAGGEVAPEDAGPEASVQAALPAAAEEAPATAEPIPDAPRAARVTAGGFDGLERLELDVDGSLSRVFAGQVEGRRADWLTATTTRLLVWDMDPASDLRPGDSLKVLYDPIEDGQEGEVQIAAMRYRSQKHGREYRGYFYRRPGAAFGDWYDEGGESVAARLKAEPIREYQQITSLLKDGRRHKGVDFTAPVGTDVLLPFDGTVTRVNWNWKSNGNCVEVRYRDGVHAKFLHLDRVAPEVQPGKALKAGTVIAASGNTGRSNAPHLHYQLNRGPDGAVLDPLEYHGTVVARLPSAEMVAFEAARAEFDAAIDGAAPSPPAVAAAPSTPGTER